MHRKHLSKATAATLIAGTMALSLIPFSPATPIAKAEGENKATLSTQVVQEGASYHNNGTLIGWNGWEYTPAGSLTPVKVNLERNADGSGTWHAIEPNGIGGVTSNKVLQKEVDEGVFKRAENGATTLVDQVTYTNLDTTKMYALIGSLAVKFDDGTYGIPLVESVNATSDNTEDGSKDQPLIIYYEPASKKLYSRPKTNGYATPTEVTDINVSLDDATGLPTNALAFLTTFTPEKSDGVIENKFEKLENTDTWGWTFVAFEYLFTADTSSLAAAASAAQSVTLDENGNKITLAMNGTTEEMVQALAANSISAYTFPAPLSGSTLTSALSAWQASEIKGFTLGTLTSYSITITSDPYYENSTTYAYVPASDLPANLSAGDIFLFKGTDGKHPATAFVLGVFSSPNNSSYKTYMILSYPSLWSILDKSYPQKYLDGTVANMSTTSIAYSGNAAGTHIGNYGYANVNGKEVAFELMSMKWDTSDIPSSAGGLLGMLTQPDKYQDYWKTHSIPGLESNSSMTYTYNVYDFEAGKYSTTTTHAPYQNVIGNRYCDDAARPNWKTSAGVQQKTLTYLSNISDPNSSTTPPSSSSSENGKVTISFNSNGGTPVSSISGQPGATIANQTIATPFRISHKFDGWWTKDGTTNNDWGDKLPQNADGTYNIPYAVFPDKSVTYYAKWTQSANVFEGLELVAKHDEINDTAQAIAFIPVAPVSANEYASGSYEDSVSYETTEGIGETGDNMIKLLLACTFAGIAIAGALTTRRIARKTVVEPKDKHTP